MGASVDVDHFQDISPTSIGAPNAKYFWLLLETSITRDYLTAFLFIECGEPLEGILYGS